ncbi:MAG TPA: hypothetical protein PK303_06150 [bacterium]|nr:hypothetical protein [bacterium]HOL35247.1 hypothetical protein [bacterium]HPP08681.1 hypothetical protein [bacterium]
MEMIGIKDFLITVAVFVVKLILVVLFFILGWLVSYLLREFSEWLLKKLGFERFCEKIGITEFLKKGQVSYTPCKLIATCVFWISVLIILFLAINLMNIKVSAIILEKFAEMIPTLLGGVFIFIVGTLLVVFAGNLAQTLANNANFSYSSALGKGIKIIGIVFLVILVLDFLKIGEKTIVFAFQAIFAGIVFASALALGMGFKDIVKENAEQLIKSIRDRKQPKGPDLEG